MLVRLDGPSPAVDGVPAGWGKWITVDSSSVSIVGDSTADVEIFAHVGKESIRVATDLGELLDELRQAGIDIAVDAWGVSSLLHHGLVRLPHTEYEDVFFLAMGDRATVTWRNGVPDVKWEVDYPWLNEKSAGNLRPSTRVLLDLLTAATERKVIEANGRGVLMLSAGKDSSSVALALAEAGYHDIPAVTVSLGGDDPEPPIAADVTSRLGLSHRIVELPSGEEAVATALTGFFESSPRACADLSQIPYAMAAATFDLEGGAVFDGGGNDSYMGLLPGHHDVVKDRLRLRSRWLAGLAGRLAPVDHPLNYLARSRAGVAFAGRTLRYRESSAVFPDAVDTTASLWGESRQLRKLDLIDLFGAYRERHGDSAGSMLKQRLAAHSVGMTAMLPFCDHEIADYYFNLPEPSRFDRANLTNKVLLREMLLEYLEYDAAKIGKHYFSFDGGRFIQHHRRFVRDEIRSCGLWDPAGVALVEEWIDRIDSHPLLYHAVLTVFMVSGWHNHSRYLTTVRAESHTGGTQS